MTRTTFVFAAFFASLLSATAHAQVQTLTLPNGWQAVEGNSSSTYPWHLTPTGGMVVQYVYDSSHFVAQGAPGPIVLQRLRVRSNAGVTCTGRTFLSAAVRLSTAPVDHLAISATFAGNHGADLATVYTGPVTVQPIPAGTSPGPWYVDIPFTTPFRYDPYAGDLVIELSHGGGTSGGTSAALDQITTGAPGGSRAHTTLGQNAATAQAVAQNTCAVVQLDYTPAAGLSAGFTATPTAGASPLFVSFTDRSYSSAPLGITSWAWDFDGDSVIDSTLQNPSFTYTACGTFSVSLTVNDGVNPASTLQRPAYVVTDVVTPSFNWTLLAPGVVQFTDTSSPAPTSWAWDLDGDGITDSTAQNPARSYPRGCTAVNVTLAASRLCRGPFAVTQRLVVSASLATRSDGSSATSGTGGGMFFDAQVLHPQGVSVCSLETKTSAPVDMPVTVEVYVAQDSYVGLELSRDSWRLVATGTARGAGIAGPPVLVSLAAPFYLPYGSYGLFVRTATGGSPMYTTIGTATTYGNADLVLTAGAAQAGPFSSSPINGRAWNGTLHYSACGPTGDAGFGFLGAGCAGTLAASRLLHADRPVMGSTLNVTATNLPFDTALLLAGTDNTTSTFGALPLDLAAFGAPGCLGRVRPDATLLIGGTGGSAVWSVAIPLVPSLQGLLFYAQALVIDPAANALGAVASDAAAGIVGM